jgi:hypothetical protein
MGQGRSAHARSEAKSYAEQNRDAVVHDIRQQLPRQGPTTIALRATKESAMHRILEHMSRDGRPFVRDELVAILFVIDPTIDPYVLSAMRVADLNIMIRTHVARRALEILNAQAQVVPAPPPPSTHPYPSAPPEPPASMNPTNMQYALGERL